VLLGQKAQLSLGCADRTAYIGGLASVRLPVEKRKRFPRVTAVTEAMVTLLPVRYILNASINGRIRYGNSAYVNDGCRQQLNFAFKIAAKPLHICSV